MIDAAAAVRDAFVAAYPAWVRERMGARGLSQPGGLGGALEEGRAWLEAELTALLALAFREQPRGPLEVFQEAMRFPTGALAAAGVAPVARDEVTANALPGDLYGLAPAASHELGEEAWHAHLAWGATKAAAFLRASQPRAGVLSRNLMDRPKLESALVAAGHEVTPVRTELPDGLDLLIADLEHPLAMALIAAAAAAGVRTVAYGPHVDEEGMAAARDAGAEEVLPRSRVLRDPGAFVARFASPTES